MEKNEKSGRISFDKEFNFKLRALIRQGYEEIKRAEEENDWQTENRKKPRDKGADKRRSDTQ